MTTTFPSLSLVHLIAAFARGRTVTRKRCVKRLRGILTEKTHKQNIRKGEKVPHTTMMVGGERLGCVETGSEAASSKQHPLKVSQESSN